MIKSFIQPAPGRSQSRSMKTATFSLFLVCLRTLGKFFLKVKCRIHIFSLQVSGPAPCGRSWHVFVKCGPKHILIHGGFDANDIELGMKLIDYSLVFFGLIFSFAKRERVHLLRIFALH